MIEEPKAMREIHGIQEKIYEETKNMTTEELLDYFRQGTEKLVGKYGLKVKTISKHKAAA